MPRRNRWMLATVTAAVVLTLTAAVAWATTTRADDPSDAFTRAVTVGAQPGDSPAAIVNGVTITKSKVAQLQTQVQTFPVNGIDASNTTSVLEYLIRGALIRQEVAKRGLLPTDAEVTAYITETQRGFQADLAAGKLPPAMVSILNGQAKTGHPLDGWLTDPAMREGTRNMLAESRLAADLAKDIPQGPMTTRSSYRRAWTSSSRSSAPPRKSRY